ncbi:MAG: TIGR04282 family arsenosugar biosynthesis glycosyltransferase [Gracilimonas sp.]|uniref:TIGR04282 family arsenosugar biosynthesis glycosyltransferase n=1 Tax=Gracilimonas sp. TaxID=1974203 RepID=UPI0019BEBB52|nr:TIGR04282 family arsenosugar biosynthesis glycosyltransferase [Gracilimonas sp.]MBD3617586.1 TIGR04282 family arsenosugar biosynthesis glycosyltransferase [Gracilimonas sp.]
MSKENKNVILIFVKNPIKGYVKTRLAKSVGDSKALQVYQSLLQITKNITEELPCDRQVWYSQSVEENDLWDINHYSKFSQMGANLGERMQFAFKQAFENGYRKTIIIGSDCADLSPQAINKAFEALDNHQVVIGPSEDGGYYLLGMTHYFPFLFKEKKWSHDSVFQDTVNQLKSQSISFKQLPVLNDIDTESDLNKSATLNL